MTAEELELRKPVWVAMSDLFLDTDVRVHFAFAALKLAESPFIVEQLTEIFTHELAPALGGNLISVAGEWAGFDSEWVVETVLKGLRGIRALRAFDIAHDDWEALAILVKALRKVPVERWKQRVALWEALSRAFLDRNPTLKVAAQDWTLEELDHVWREEMWPSYGRDAAEFHKYSSALNPSLQEIEQAWTRFRNALS